MFPVTKQKFDEIAHKVGIHDVTAATIRQICMLADIMEAETGEKIVHLEIGNPGLPANRIGIEAERRALADGVAGHYPNISGIPVIKQSGSRFLKAFLKADIPPQCVIPTVGSMQGSYAAMTLLAHRDPAKDTMLFINPGFPVQRNQAHMIGLKQQSFDLFDCRGPLLEQKLEAELSKGNVTALIYSNPNNPAWTNFTDDELAIIGRMATKHDVVVIEDLAYLGLDFRQHYGAPDCDPYIPTVARHTDNYILLVSASKIFSYAGQRIALVAFSPKLFDTANASLQSFFGVPTYGAAFVFGILYALSSGTAHSAQHALAAMLQAAVDGRLDFVDECRAYQKAGARAKQAFVRNGFHLVYATDGHAPISDGFFFTAGYGDMDSRTLQEELLRYGVATISLPSTGSRQNGVRVCVSMLDNEQSFQNLETRLNRFNHDHQLL